jgi:hypothetical protein
MVAVASLKVVDLKPIWAALTTRKNKQSTEWSDILEEKSETVTDPDEYGVLRVICLETGFRIQTFSS